MDTKELMAIYDAGYDAGYDGEPKSNPYKFGSDEYEEWNDGYEDGERELNRELG